MFKICLTNIFEYSRVLNVSNAIGHRQAIQDFINIERNTYVIYCQKKLLEATLSETNSESSPEVTTWRREFSNISLVVLDNSR